MRDSCQTFSIRDTVSLILETLVFDEEGRADIVPLPCLLDDEPAPSHASSSLPGSEADPSRQSAGSFERG